MSEENHSKTSFSDFLNLYYWIALFSVVILLCASCIAYFALYAGSLPTSSFFIWLLLVVPMISLLFPAFLLLGFFLSLKTLKKAKRLQDTSSDGGTNG